ncbi:MAG: ABC transporter substrate-binding protein [Rubrivivax sp.]
MNRKFFIAALAFVLTSAAALAQAQTTLRVFSGGQNQRPDLMRQLFDRYEAVNPGVKIQIETGGATSELQRQYLSTVLNAKDPSIDVFLIDIVNPAQYFGAGWLEPLDTHLGPAATVLRGHLPVYATSNVVNGKLAALPGFADAMFMYYRRDLLDKHKIAVPRTWEELSAAAQRIQKAEGGALQGLSIKGAPIEGAVCTFLLPYWSQGKDFNDAAGRLTLDRPAAVRGLQQWLRMVDEGVVKRNVAEVKTPDTVNEFKAGQVLFAINWSWAWDRFQDDADSKVKGRVGVMPMPAMAGGRSATCIGGWQWAVSAFSRHKAAAARLVQFMGTREASRFLAAQGALLPVYPEVYTEAEVLKAVPWFKDAATVVNFGRSRPMSERYGEVSDTIRTVTSAVLARTTPPEEGVAQIEGRLRRVMR